MGTKKPLHLDLFTPQSGLEADAKKEGKKKKKSPEDMAELNAAEKRFNQTTKDIKKYFQF